ncbi:MAG: TonB-dependent receptor [Sphingomonadaceae bacterium]|nr:TonB-dependent receptor [Sphingomonadaceae bacterium]
MTNKKTVVAAFVASCSWLAISMPASAQEAERKIVSESAGKYDIPAQSLDSALAEFARVSDADLLYSSDLVAGKRSSRVSGDYTPTEALRRLLNGTGLSLTKVSANVFSLQAEGTVSAGDGTGTPVAGVVRDALTGSILPGAEVSVVGTDLTTTTDERGFFYFPEVPAGATQIQVSYLGDAPARYPLSGDAYERERMSVMFGDTGDEIIVRGFQSSLQKALNQQLRSDNNATVVSSDLLGSFPAETVSEALRRVPGVAFGRNDDTGEGSRITVRGFSSEAINIQLNGLELQGTGFERTIDLSGFLADNISQITIQKSLLPSHESSGSGGLVEIETKSGLDYEDGLTAQIGIEGETNFDRDFGGEYQINGLVSARLAEDFGVVATVQYRKTDRLNYGADIVSSLPPVLPAGFTGLSLVPASQQFPFDPEISQALDTGVSYLKRDREEENLTASLNFAWDVSPTTNLRLDLQRIQRDAYSETARTTATYLTSAVDMPIPELGGEVRRRTVLASLRPNLAFNVTDLSTETNNVSFRGTTNLDRWNFKYKAGYSRATSRSNNANLSAAGAAATNLTDLIDPATIVLNPDDDAAMTQRVVNGGIIYQPNGLPVLSLTDAGLAYLNDPANYALTSASKTLSASPTDAFTLEGSVRYQPAAEFIDYFEVGAKWDRSERKANDDVFATTSTGSLLSVESYIRIFGRDTGLDAFGAGLVDNSALGDIGADIFRAPFLTGASVDAIFAGLPNFLADDPSTTFNEQRFTYTDRRSLDPILDSGGLVPVKTIEDKTAGYFQGKFNLGDFELIGGARYERVYRSGQTLAAPSVRLASGATEPRETFVQAGLVQFTDLSGTQDVWTPSMIVNYRPMDNLVARFAYFRSTVNPDFRLIRRSRDVILDLRSTVNRATIRESNPDLRPTKTDNYDFDISYYFDDTPGLIRAGFFYKKVKNNFTNVFFLDGDDDSVREDILAYFGDLATARPDLVAFDADTEFLRNRPENGDGGKIYGVELEAIRQLTFLPGRLSNITLLGNLTWTKGDFPTLVSGRDDTGTLTQFTLDRPLADQAEWVYNVSASYEEGGFEGRVIYTYQSSTADVFEIHGLDQELPSYDTLDVRLNYTFDLGPTNMSIYLQGDDLLRGSNEIDLRRAITSEFNGNGSSFYFPDIYQFNGGRTITAGVRVRF